MNFRRVAGSSLAKDATMAPMARLRLMFRLALALIVAVLLVTLPACGSDDGGNTPGGTQTETTETKTETTETKTETTEDH